MCRYFHSGLQFHSLSARVQIMPNHESHPTILRSLRVRALGTLALSAAICCGAGLLGGCGQKGDLRPTTPKQPIQISIATSSNTN
jgi:hypothetical protein